MLIREGEEGPLICFSCSRRPRCLLMVCLCATSGTPISPAPSCPYRGFIKAGLDILLHKYWRSFYLLDCFGQETDFGEIHEEGHFPHLHPGFCNWRVAHCTAVLYCNLNQTKSDWLIDFKYLFIIYFILTTNSTVIPDFSDRGMTHGIGTRTPEGRTVVFLVEHWTMHSIGVTLDLQLTAQGALPICFCKPKHKRFIV